MKLTAAQRRALDLNAMFDSLWLTAQEMKCSGSAAYSLVQQELLRQRGSTRSTGYEYRITPTGRAALEEA